MTRTSSFASPFLLGFGEIEKAIERAAGSPSDGYPPYNLERLAPCDGLPERLRIVVAVAGFTRDQLEVMLDEHQLVIRGRQIEEHERVYLHRGIAARRFQRTFVLAEGMRVLGADLSDGLLSVDLVRPEQERTAQKINISVRDS